MNIKNFENETRKFVAGNGNFHVLEYMLDSSVSPANASTEYVNLRGAIKKQEKMISNRYEIKKKTFDIKIKKTDYNRDGINKKNSNIEEFFEIIDW